MSAATKIRPMSRRAVRTIDLPVKAATKILGGTIVCTDGSGWAVPATAVAALRSWGPAQGTQDNTTGSNGALTVNVRLSRDVEVILWDNDTGTALTRADVGTQAHMLDNQTLTGAATGSPGPYVYEVTSEGVWAFCEMAFTVLESAGNITVADAAGHFPTDDLESVTADLGARIHLKVADAAALQAVTAADRADGMIVAKVDDDTIWTFDSGSAAGSSSWVIVPTAGTGRWVRKMASLADLAATTNGDGASLVGIEDAAGNTTATTVEASLAELYGFNKLKVQQIQVTLVAGTVTLATGITVTSSTRVVGINPSVRGGTFPAGGFQSLTAGNVAGAPGTGAVTITARKADGTLENGCTDTLCALLIG